jgi:outer membrane protein assembly factor BamB
MRLRPFVAGLAPMLLAVFLLPGVTAGSDWPRFRGPNGSGLAADATPTPTTWSPTENLQWKIALPGPGISCPIVVGQRVFVTCYSGYGLSRENPGDQYALLRHLVCVDRDSGEVRWDKTVAPYLPEDEFSGLGLPEHGYATHTPVSDGERVYVFFGKTGALAFDMDGNQLWHNDGLGTQSDKQKWGSSSSPIIVGNVLVVSAGPEGRAIFGLNKMTGEELWRVSGEKPDGLGNVWSTPVVSNVGNGRTDVVIGVTNQIWGLDPDTGEQRWVYKDFPGWCFNTTLAVSDGLIVGVEGKGGLSFGLRPGGTGDISASQLVWSQGANNRYASPVLIDGRGYYVSSEVIHCFDVATGAEIFKARLPEGNETKGGGIRSERRSGDEGSDFSSPVIADGKLYFVMRIASATSQLPTCT